MDEEEVDTLYRGASPPDDNPELFFKQRDDIWYNVSIPSNDMKALLRIRDHFAGEDKSQLEGLAFDILDRNFGQFEYNF